MHKFFIITSNFSIDELFANESDVTREAIKRRFVCMNFPKPYVAMPHTFKPPQPRDQVATLLVNTGALRAPIDAPGTFGPTADPHTNPTPPPPLRGLTPVIADYDCQDEWVTGGVASQPPAGDIDLYCQDDWQAIGPASLAPMGDVKRGAYGPPL